MNKISKVKAFDLLSMGESSLLVSTWTRDTLDLVLTKVKNTIPCFDFEGLDYRRVVEVKSNCLVFSGGSELRHVVGSSYYLEGDNLTIVSYKDNKSVLMYHLKEVANVNSR